MKKNISFFLLSAAVMSFAFSSKPSRKVAMKVLQGFCNYVPSGTAVVAGDTSSVQAFYMSSGEVTNFQYMEFLYDLKRNGEHEKYQIAMVDSMAWRGKLASSERYSEYYHRHPAYRNYPVVNISKEGAELYCEWLTQKYDSLSNGELHLNFRLPTHAEWMRAARGDNHRHLYAWGGSSLRNEDGLIMANHMLLDGANISRNIETGDLEVVLPPADQSPKAPAVATDVTAPSTSYFPNEFGMYNLNGNVAEMISDGNVAVGGSWNSPGYDIRNESIVAFEKASPTVGFRVVATYLEPVK